MSQLSLPANVSWTLASNIVYAICQWMMLVVLARTSSPEVVGVFALALATTAPVVMFAQLQLRTVQATDTMQAYRFPEYLQLRLLAMVLAFGTILVICQVMEYGRAVLNATLAVGLWKCLDSCSDIIYGLLQLHERMHLISISLMLKGALSLAAFAGVLLSGGGLIAALYSVAFASTAVLIWYDMPISHGLRHVRASVANHASNRPHGPPLARLAALAWLALPLGAVQLLVSLSANAPRYFLERSFGTREVGIFAVIAYFVTAGQVVITALGQAALPRLARFASSDLGAYRRLMIRLLAIALLMGITGIAAAVLFGPIVLKVFYGFAYQAHNGALLWMMISAAIAYLAWLLGSAMTAARIFRPQVLLLAASTAATVIACAYAVPRAGIKGATAAFGFGMLVQAILTAMIVHNWMKLRRAGAAPLMPTALTGLAPCDRC
jgi:O-antigen/teichoic acid export membrane protein